MLARLIRGLLLVSVLVGWANLTGCVATPPTDDTNDNAGQPTDDQASDDQGGTGGNDDGNAGDPAGKFAVFQDPDSRFSTDQVHDVEDQIVQFDTEALAIVWAEDGTSYQTGVWSVDGNFLLGGAFQVRFGRKDGRRLAFFTETGPATICDLEVQGGFLSISPTSVPVPQE